MAAKRIPKQFFLFLGLSTLIWMLITLSKEYRTSLDFEVSYANIPQNRLLLETSENKLTLAVTATGFKLLRTRLQKEPLTLDASQMQQNLQGQFYILLARQEQLLQEQLLSDVMIQSVLKDSMYLDIDILATKKVKVEPNIKVNYHVGYGLLGNIEVEPDSITISGSKQQLDTLTKLSLKPVVLTDVKEDFERQVALALDKNNQIKLETTKIKISGKVDKFTEGSLKVPFSMTNVPDSLKITTLTEEVTIVFVVGLSDFNKVSSNSFVVECDFAYSNSQNLSYVIPKVIQKPRFVKNIKLVPQTIDYLIQK